MGCGGSGDPNRNPGGPFTNIGVGDAGTQAGGDASGGATARDGSVDSGDARRDGAGGTGGTTVTTGSGGMTGTVDGGTPDVPVGGGGGIGGSGTVTGSGGMIGGAACQECEAKYCQDSKDFYDICISGKDPTTGMVSTSMAPMSQGTPRKTLCQDVLTCVRGNASCLGWGATESVEPCWCGKDVGGVQCLSGMAAGPCKAAIERAAEPESPAASVVGEAVANRLTDPAFGLGAAVNLIQECDLQFCRGVCLGLSGSGGFSGTGSGGGGGTLNVGGASGTGAAGAASGTAGRAGGASGTGSTSAGGSSAVGGMSGGGTGGAGGATTYVMCRSCETAQCPEVVAGCDQLSGVAAAGTGMGKPRKELCLDLVNCARSTKCAKNMGDLQPCFCGTAGDIPCLTGAANGVCKAVVEAAAESAEAGVVADRFSAVEFAIGGAVGLLACDYEFCAGQCANGDAGATGSGGRTGTGGAPVIPPPPPPTSTGGAPVVNTGGASGTGGAPGSGGSVGSGGGAVASGGTPGSGGVVASGGAVGSGGTPGSGGVVASGGAVGSGGAVASGGQNSSGGAGGVPTGPCPDLDNNGTSDCQESMAVNSGFHASADYWTVEDFMTQAWGAIRDAAGNSASGGLGVTNASVVDVDGMTEGGSRQCVRVTAGIAYRLALQAFIPSGQGSGSGSASVRFYASTNCVGTASGFWQTGQLGDTNGWRTIEGTTTPAPVGAQSMMLRLVALKSFRNPAFTIFFDNVLLKPQ